MNRTCASRAVAVLLCAGLLACEDSEAAEDAGTRDAGDARVDAGASPQDAAEPMRDAAVRDAGTSDKCDSFDGPFERVGTGGNVVARFARTEPALEFTGYYDWTLELRSSSGDAIGDAVLAADAEMPAHGHGTTPIKLHHEPGSSSYELREVNLFMEGKWEVTIDVRTDNQKDRLVFRACPRDPPDAGDDGEDGEDGGTPRRRMH